MPPCKSVLQNKIKRSNYIAKLIKSAVINNIETDDPCRHGWTLDEHAYVIDFYVGSMYPEELIDLESEITFDSDTDDEDGNTSQSDDDDENDDMEENDADSDDEVTAIDEEKEEEAVI